MARATTHLDMLVHSGMFYSQIQPQISATLTAMAARGVHVRLCFGDPEGASAALRDREERIGGTLSAKVRSSLCYYRELVGVGGIEIRLHDTTLYASLWRYDDEMLINPHAYGEPGSANPVIHLRRSDPSPLIEHYQRSFERVWETARPWAGEI